MEHDQNVVENEIKADVEKRAPICNLENIDTVRIEYAGNEAFLRKIAFIEKDYSQIRRVRGDGNCFFRGFMFRYLEILLQKPRHILLQVIDHLQSGLNLLVQVGYPETSIEIFFEVVIELLEELDTKSLSDIESLFAATGDSDYFVCFARLVCAGYLKHHQERFTPFLNGFRDIDEFCSKEVEPMGKECEQIQIIALCEYMHVTCCVEYMDATNADTASKHVFGEENPQNINIDFLYRPSHYDLLYV